MSTPDFDAGTITSSPSVADETAGCTGRPVVPPVQWVPAGFWRRTGAALIDVVGGGLVIFFGAGMLASLAGRPPHAHHSSSDLVLASLVAAILFLGPLTYTFVYWRDGATLGMHVVGLRLVDAHTGDLPSTEQVLLRMAGSFYCALPAGLGFLSVAAARNRRGWHDRLSGTSVVRARPLSYGWVWDGTEWVWTPAPAASTAPAPTVRRTPAALPAPPSVWTWSDVLPLLVLFVPVEMLSQGLVIVALHVVRIGHGHRAAVSLVVQAVAYGADLGLIGLFLGVRRHAGLRDLGLGLPQWRWLLAVAPAVFVAWSVQRVLGELGSAFLPTSPNNQCRAIRWEYASGLALGLVAVAVIAPVVEEIVFRGMLFGWLRGRVPVAAAVVVSSAIFALAHVGWKEWSLLLPVFGIGCVLAALYHYSRSLWPGILVHASINTVATLIVVLGGAHC